MTKIAKCYGKIFVFLRLSMFSTNRRLYNCAKLQHKMTKTAAEKFFKISKAGLSSFILSTFV